MTMQVFNLRVCVIATTIFFWYWSRLRVGILPLEVKKIAIEHNRNISLAFFALIAIVAATPLQAGIVARHLVGLSSAYIYAVFAMLANPVHSQFWHNKRNRVFVLFLLTVLAAVLPEIIHETAFFPMTCSFMIARSCQLRNHAFFNDAVSDLDAVRKKILSVNANVTSENLIYACQQAKEKAGYTPSQI